MIAMHGNSIFCIQLEKNKKTKKTWKNAWQKWYCGVLLMSTFERTLWRDIEVVITRRSWKPFVRKGAWVRIPPSPFFMEKYPSWPKGLPWKGSRSLIAARGFKSLLLRHFYQIRSWKKLRKKMKKYLTSLKRCDKISLAAEKAGANKTDPWKLNSRNKLTTHSQFNSRVSADKMTRVCRFRKNRRIARLTG